MIFLTVGTQFPFDRLVVAIDQAMDKGLIGETVFAQIGQSGYKPRNFDAVSALEKSEFDRYVAKASRIISHAGMGSITAAMDNDKPLLVMPRLKAFREVVNDHQMAIAKEYEKQKYLLAAYSPEELPAKLEQLKTFVPRKRVVQVDKVVARIVQFLKSMEETR